MECLALHRAVMQFYSDHKNERFSRNRYTTVYKCDNGPGVSFLALVGREASSFDDVCASAGILLRLYYHEAA